MAVLDLTPQAQAVADRVIAEESASRRHLVIALSGSHAYGFPSPDSDLDIKASHAAPAASFLGLAPVPKAADRLEVIDGVEIDYTSNEIAGLVSGVLSGNGNYIERVLGELILATSPEHDELVPLVRGALSQRVHRHYRGFGTSQRRALEEAEKPTAKKLLYVLRTALTGTHLLRTGELRVDLSHTAPLYGVDGVGELIEAKRAGERVELDAALAAAWGQRLDPLFAGLDDALASSVLPAEPPNAAALEAWLIDLRRAELAG